MKIYIDELPECCNDCEFGYFYDCQYCSLRPDLAREDIWVEKEKYCPLHSLADYTKQVRKEVCDGLALPLIKHFQKDAEFTVEEICKWTEEYKDQIEQGKQND